MGHYKDSCHFWGVSYVGRSFVHSDVEIMQFHKEICFLLPLDREIAKEFMGKFSSNIPPLLKFLSAIEVLETISVVEEDLMVSSDKISHVGLKDVSSLVMGGTSNEGCLVVSSFARASTDCEVWVTICFVRLTSLHSHMLH